MVSGVHATSEGIRSDALSLATSTSELAARITVSNTALQLNEVLELLRRTVSPFYGSQGRELFARYDFQLGPHGIVSCAAKFPTYCLVFTGTRKLKLRLADRTRQDLHRVISTIEGE